MLAARNELELAGSENINQGKPQDSNLALNMRSLVS